MWHDSMGGKWRGPVFAVLLLGIGAGTGCQSVSDVPVGSLYERLIDQPSDGRDTFDEDSGENWMEDRPAAWEKIAGRYRAETKDDEATVSLRAGDEFTNVFVEVDYIRSVATVGSGGVVVRASDDFQGWKSGSAYMFALGSDGEQWQYAVYRQTDGKLKFLKEWTAHSAFQRVTNQLAVLAYGDILQYYANGELLWEGRAQQVSANEPLLR